MTYNDAVAIFGQTITVRYFDGSGYVDASASLVGQDTVIISYADTAADSMYNGAPYIYYELTGITVSSNPDYIQVRTNPSYSILDTDQIHTFIAVSGGRDIPVSVYNNDRWDWNFQYFENNVYDTDRYGTEYHSQFRCNQGWFSYVPIDATFNAPTDIYCLEANFYGNSVSNGSLYIAVGIPYVSISASGAAGTLPDSGGGGSSGGDINVNIDLSETNEELQTQTGIISSILGWLGDFFQDLGDTVISWVVPSENFFENWVEEIKDDIIEHFVPHLPLNGQLENIASDLALALGQGGVSSVQFPAISVPGTEFSIPAYSVPLVPSGFEDFVEYVKVMIDCLCTVWVFNMVLNRIHALIVGETSVEVINSAD